MIINDLDSVEMTSQQSGLFPEEREIIVQVMGRDVLEVFLPSLSLGVGETQEENGARDGELHLGVESLAGQTERSLNVRDRGPQLGGVPDQQSPLNTADQIVLGTADFTRRTKTDVFSLEVVGGDFPAYFAGHEILQFGQRRDWKTTVLRV